MVNPIRHFPLALLFAIGLAPVVSGAPDFVPEGTRTEKSIKGGKIPFWGARPDQAEVLTATFLGGKGHEWLVAGGFQPDGTVVVLGNVAGPIFEMPAKISVLGRDGAPPPMPERPVDPKNGKPLPLSWKMPGVTGFVAFLSPDLKTVKSVVRFPWESGAITGGLVDDKGAIYVAGRATPKLGALGAFQPAPVGADAERKSGGCDHTFFAKIAPDGSRLLWGLETKGLSDAPRVSLRRDGNLAFSAQDVKTVTPEGRVLASAVIPGGVRETTSVSPVDGTIVRGGEHHWSTGREPWRCPILNIHEPDGALRYQLYDWGGPYVGLDNSRLVSDSAVRLVSHDRDGNILAVAWSDGGNSVMNNQPTDVRRSTGLRGTGLNAAGAGATSFAYLIKIEPKDYQVIGWTFWGTRYGGKANGIKVCAVEKAEDGSFCVAGGASWGLVQTPNFIGRGEPGGSYVAVLTPDLGGVRFCSAIPGAGAAMVGNEPSDEWGIGSGRVNGQARALFFSGAEAAGEAYGLTAQTPVVDAAQGAFGGGWSDGYLLVLDLSKGADTLPKAAVPTRTYDRLTIATAGGGGGGKKGPEPAGLEGKVCSFAPDIRKYATVDVEVRDAQGKMWPSFLYGKPAGGELRSGPSGKASGSLGVLADKWCQPKGKQDRRVLGEWITGGTQAPPFKFTIRSLGEPQTETLATTDKNGKAGTKTVTYQVADALIEAGDLKLVVAPKCTVQWSAGGRDGSTVGVRLTAYWTSKGRELGLKKLGDEEIDFRVSMQGYEPK